MVSEPTWRTSFVRHLESDLNRFGNPQRVTPLGIWYNPDHSTFLKNFGKFHVASLSQDIVPADKIVVEMLTDLQSEVSRLRRSIPRDIARSRNQDGLAEGTIRIASEITRYLADNPKSDLSKLIGSREFEREMEDKCDAPKYFDSPIEFRNVLTRTAKDIMLARITRK
jgi:hypothetical protein